MALFRRHAAWVLGVLPLALAIGWPLVAIVQRCLSDGRPPEGGWQFNARQWTLLGKTILLSAGGALGALAVSIAPTVAIGMRRGRSRPGWFFMATALCLVMPPMVLAIGWQGFISGTRAPEWMTVAIWSLWAWPVMAMLVGLTWRGGVGASIEAALLDASRFQVLFRVGAAGIGSALACGTLIVFLLCAADYAVPHTFAVQVYATELFGWAANSPYAIDALWPSLPPAGIGIFALLLVWRLGRATGSHGWVAHSAAMSERGPIGWRVTGWLVVLATFGVPIGCLLSSLDGPGWIVEALRVYKHDFGWTILVGVLASIVASASGVALTGLPHGYRILLVGAVAAGVLPGALIGGALVAAYNREWASAIYDHWPIVVLAHLARFAWIGLATGLIARRAAQNVMQIAAVDGASPVRAFFFAAWPAAWPVLGCGAWVILAWSLCEIAATSLVRPPGYTPIALVILDKFHFFEDEMLASLSVCLVALCLPAALLLDRAIQRGAPR